jgi:hypothetical protein
MKRSFFLLAGALLLFSRLLAQPGGGSLSGAVTDPTGHPLAGVSIFLNSTSIGTVSHTDGSFVLTSIPRGKYQLVISAIGYATFLGDIDGAHLPPELKVSLQQKATELEAVTVEPYLKDGWRLWGQFFLDNFIGTGDNARSCTIKNKGVLRFHYSKKSRRLTVSATEPLIIENTGLGYTLEYRMEEFSSDFNSHIVIYLGYPFFREMSSIREKRRQRWEQNRQVAYTGSILHFMRSLYGNRLAEEGFILQRKIAVPNMEKQRVKEIYRPDPQKPDTFSIDTLHYFWGVLQQPDSFSRNVRVSPDSVVTRSPDQAKALFFPGKITVYFGNPGKGTAYRGSEIQLITPARVNIEENGNYYPPQELISSGFWGRSEKIVNLLPIDYGQHP